MALCGRHGAESLAWLDWIGTPSCQAYAQGGINLVQIGTPTVRSMADGLSARAGRAYGLVRQQQALIAAECARGQGCCE